MLLRILEKRLRGSTIKAFADDIGGVFQDWEADSPILESIFTDFAKMSGLELNVNKTVCIPLWDAPIEVIRGEIKNRDSIWKEVSVESQGTYLGFSVGPGSPGVSWEKPIHKFSKRCKLWGNLGLGTYFSTMAYNTFAASTLGFVAQLTIPTNTVLRAEQKGINRLLLGPGNWRKESDPFYLKESFGQPISFKSTAFAARAAKFRVKNTHDRQRRRGGRSTDLISIQEMSKRLTNLIEDHRFLNRVDDWSEWYSSSYVTILQRNATSLEEEFGITEGGIGRDIVGHPPPWSEEERAKVRRNYQKKVYQSILIASQPCPVDRIRDNITRWSEDCGYTRGWGISTHIGIAAPKIHRHLVRLRSLVPPRVCSSAFKTIFNGWITHKRQQKSHSSSNRCWFGCNPEAKDCIEHYCMCPAVLNVLQRKLRIVLSRENALAFWMLDCPNDDAAITCSALSTYAAYSTVNLYRNLGKHVSQEVAEDAMGQFLIQSTGGHEKLRKFLDDRWAAGMRHI